LTERLNEYLRAFKASRRFAPHIVHHREIPGKGAVFSDLARPLHPALEKALARQELVRLYGHQVRAVDAVRDGSHVMVATPTASGKSLIYNIPVLDGLLTEPGQRALYLFPLKALAQDQLRTFEAMAAGLERGVRPRAAIIDGDTSAYQRKKLRVAPPQVLISNPEMLHLSLLGYHDIWSAFWPSLRYIVVDEVHTYRGITGSHMAWVLRRLKRICRKYGSEPLFIMSSATVGNPEQLAVDLTGEQITVITESGAPAAKRHFLFLNPTDSAAYAATLLVEEAIRQGLRTIVYAQSRKIAELVSVWAQDRLGDLRRRLSPYRAGFLPEERREIEQGLAGGELFGVVSTSALELGIDIGELDLCILVGYPGTIMTTWQRSGRVGRRQQDSAVILIGQEDALDQHFMRHPDDFFSRQVEDAVLNPGNLEIMGQHLVCAAAEQPLEEGEELLGEQGAGRCIEELAAEGRLLASADNRRWHSGRRYPHRHVDLRGGGRNFFIYSEEGHRLLGEIDGHRALKECHPGAVYLHRGRTWLIASLDMEAREVTAVGRKVNYFTRPLSEKSTEILHLHATRQVGSCRVSLGELRVTDKVAGFQKRLVRGQKLIATEALTLPPVVFETEGLWIEIPHELQRHIEEQRLHFMGGIHAMEHAAIGIFPLLVLCDRNDVGGISQPDHPQLERAAVFIYDGHAGGVGLSRQVYGRVEELLQHTLEVMRGCGCDNGCPSCVHSPKCGSGNRPIDKQAAELIVAGLLQGGCREDRPAPLILGREKERARPAEAGGPEIESIPERGFDSAAALEKSFPAGGREEEKAKPVIIDFAEARRRKFGGPTGVGPAPEETDASPPSFVVFDVETKRSAAEVGGWHLACRMGISVAVLYDSLTDTYHTYPENRITDLILRLKESPLIVGFNNKRFDNAVLSAYTDLALHDLPTIDLLEEVKRHLNYRLSLDSLAEHTLGVKKNGNGLMALKWYKEGMMEQLSAYCRKDVEITRDLFLHGLREKHFLFKNKAGHLVRCPLSYHRYMERLGK
jgi:DEAD/DEAH box helicase domain-containing protein